MRPIRIYGTVLGIGLLAAGCVEESGRSSSAGEPTQQPGGAKADDVLPGEDTAGGDDDGDDAAPAQCETEVYYCDGSVSSNCSVSEDQFDCALFDAACTEGHCECEPGQEACTTDSERSILWYCDEGGIEDWREVCKPGHTCIDYGSIAPGCVGPGLEVEEMARAACLHYFDQTPCSEETDPERFDPDSECTPLPGLSPAVLAEYVDGLRACEDKPQPLCWDALDCHNDLVDELGP